MKDKSISSRVLDVFNYTLLAVIALLMLFPFLYVIAVSFSSYTDYMQSDFMLIPKEWVLDAYRFIFASKSFLRSLWVTVLITVAGTLVNLAFTASLAYVLARPVFGRKPVTFLVLFTMLFNAGMIPTYLVVKGTGLLDSVWALILPVAIAPFYLIVMRQFFESIPSELHEAATIDGANDLQSFWRIILPLSKPSLAAFGLFYAVMHWNNYFSAILYMNDQRWWPIQVILRQIVVVNEAQNTLAGGQILLENAPPAETIQMAAILVATVPILIVYPFLQKHFAKGVMLGSVKG
ncbi:carbohydrate ABC transporter permease [Paenibacillus hemerocallicola]|jgi:putative aldouronate transport system permease protein|uniref:Carbohydrate ABC transporter permease n=1 Tax=Paenibacillus hemerocallicola TaxID=1172614 RepID=A0A5C4T196_9BACL|nr:carbohydrate ABC transporter permease [Paenibacillus hemerocallicola]TNJ62872.1 carbohydrate ABC transporter permease [Paenibacillus hemerocallicola]